MPAVQRFYETTVMYRPSVEGTEYLGEQELSAHFFSIPLKAVANGEQDFAPEAMVLELGLEPIGQIAPGNFIPALAQCLAERPLEEGEYPSSDYVAFAEYLAFAQLIPFEESPLEGTSLGSIVATGSGGAIGAYVGFAVAGGPTPLLLVTVPAGMIICGAAMGTAEGLQDGLRDRIKRWVGTRRND